MERPALLPGRWRATRQGREPRLLLTIQLAVPVLPLGPVLEGGLDPLGHGPFAQSFHRGTAHLDRLGDRGVRPLGSLWTGIRLQQDTSAGGRPCRSFTLLDGLPQQEAFCSGEGHDVELGHGEALLGRDWWCVRARRGLLARSTHLPPFSGPGIRVDGKHHVAGPCGTMSQTFTSALHSVAGCT